MKVRFFNYLINFLFPKICIVSDRKLDDENSNQFIDDKILNSIEKTNVNDLASLKYNIKSDICFSLFRFYEDSDIQTVVHHFKYTGMKKLAYFMGSYLCKQLTENKYNFDVKEFDIISPIALYKTKFRERSYNQSDYLSRGINSILNIQYIPDLLIRIKNTKTQTHLTRKEREENLSNAFIVNKKYSDAIEGKKIIVIDDVVTSGSTLNEAIKELKKTNVSKICALTLAMAVEKRE